MHDGRAVLYYSRLFYLMLVIYVMAFCAAAAAAAASAAAAAPFKSGLILSARNVNEEKLLSAFIEIHTHFYLFFFVVFSLSSSHSFGIRASFH